MKVLYDPEIFNLQIFGGISLYFTRLLEYFNKNSCIEFEIPLIYSDNRYIRQAEFSNYISFYEYNFPFDKLFKKFLYACNNINFQHKIRSGKFDILHPTYFNASFLKNIGKKPFVLTVHDMTQEIVPEYFVFDKSVKEFTESKKLLIEKASRIIAISENTKKDIINLYGIDEDKIDMIYHALPLDFKEDEISEFDFVPEKYILFVGQRSKYKNFERFLLAIADILKQDNELKLVCAGGPHFNKNEKKFISHLELENKVIRLPVTHNEHIIRYYKNAICFVFPSVYEGFGFPLLEAIQCGCPVLCSDASAFPEVAGDAALYFDPYDLDSMKNSVEKIINDPQLRNELVKRGNKQLKKFSWKNTARKTLKIYEKVLNHG